jgi:hypothetical protein
MESILILIHGTFASNAPWTKAESVFCKHLERKVGGKITFDRFNWSGGNSHKSRVAAAEQLYIKLDKLAEVKDKKKIIIAHSHGGNVALYALRKLGHRGLHFNLITLATPFLNATLRDYRYILEINMIIIPLMVATIFATGLGTLSLLYLKQWTLESAVVIVLLAVVLFKLLRKKALKAEIILDEQITSIFSSITFPVKENCNRVLALIDKRDEITAWFKLLNRIWQRLSTWQTAIFDNVIMLLFFFIVLIIPITMKDVFSAANSYDAGINLLVGTSVLLPVATVVFGLTILISVLNAVIFFFVKSNVLALGWENWTQQMFINIRPHPTPHKGIESQFVEFRGLSKGFALKHSIYENPEAIEQISDWINNESVQKEKPNYVVQAAELNKVEALRATMILLLRAGKELLAEQIAKEDIGEQKAAALMNSLIDQNEAISNEQLASWHMNKAILYLCDIGKKSQAIFMYDALVSHNLEYAKRYVGAVYEQSLHKLPTHPAGNKQWKALLKVVKKIGGVLLQFIIFYLAISISVDNFGKWNSTFWLYSLLSLSNIYKLVIAFRYVANPKKMLLPFSVIGYTFNWESVFTAFMIGECLLFGAFSGFLPIDEFLSTTAVFYIPAIGVMYLLFSNEQVF